MKNETEMRAKIREWNERRKSHYNLEKDRNTMNDHDFKELLVSAVNNMNIFFCLRCNHTEYSNIYVTFFSVYVGS